MACWISESLWSFHSGGTSSTFQFPENPHERSLQAEIYRYRSPSTRSKMADWSDDVMEDDVLIRPTVSKCGRQSVTLPLYHFLVIECLVSIGDDCKTFHTWRKQFCQTMAKKSIPIKKSDFTLWILYEIDFSCRFIIDSIKLISLMKLMNYLSITPSFYWQSADEFESTATYIFIE